MLMFGAKPFSAGPAQTFLAPGKEASFHPLGGVSVGSPLNFWQPADSRPIHRSRSDPTKRGMMTSPWCSASDKALSRSLLALERPVSESLCLRLTGVQDWVNEWVVLYTRLARGEDQRSQRRGSQRRKEAGVGRATALKLPRNSIPEDLFEELFIPCGTETLRRDASLGRVTLQETQRHPPQQGKVLGRVSVSDAAVILPERHVQLPVQLVLDAPGPVPSK